MFEKFIKNLNKSKELGKFEDKWINIMANTGLYNKMKQTFSINFLKKTDYGYSAKILIVDGLRFNELEDKKDYINDAYGCMTVFNKSKRSNIIEANFIFKTPIKLEFKPMEKLKATDLYLGNTYSSQPILVDMVKYPHALITGGTRSGKSKLMDCILTNLITNCTEYELELYLSQVAKSDLVLYEDAKQTRAFADDLYKTLTMLEHVDNKMSERDKLIRPYRKVAQADNYRDYNSINIKNPLSTVYVVFDEMSSLFQTKGDDKETKQVKEKIIALIRRIAQFGAGLGVFLLMSLQRPTVDNLDPFIKSQSTCIISFRQNNSKSSEVALDDATMALGLEQREFIYHTNQYQYGLVPLVNNKKIYQFIKPYLQANHRNLFRDQKKQNYRNPIAVDFTRTNKDRKKTKDEILKDNISKINNYVPYEPVKNGREKV